MRQQQEAEQAARDLYASEWETFRYVTAPLLMPGIVAGAMLAFVISMDDFIITLMVGGAGSTTLPVYIYSMIRRSEARIFSGPFWRGRR